MKKVLFSVLVASAALVATPAFAAPAVNINLEAVGTSQVTQQDVTQVAGAAAIAVGAVNDSTNEASAIAGNNLSNVDTAVEQTASLGNGNALAASVGQLTSDVVSQGTLAVAGSGALSAGSTNSALAASLNNQAGVKVTVKQN